MDLRAIAELHGRHTGSTIRNGPHAFIHPPFKWFSFNVIERINNFVSDEGGKQTG